MSGMNLPAGNSANAVSALFLSQWHHAVRAELGWSLRVRDAWGQEEDHHAHQAFPIHQFTRATSD